NSIKFSNLSLVEVENYLCKGLDGISLNDKEYLNMGSLMKSLPALTDFLMDFYTSVSDKSPLALYGKFKVHFKFLLYICLLMKNVDRFESYWDSREIINENTNSEILKMEYWKYVIDKTTEHFKSIEQNGFNQSIINQSNDVDSVWNIFQDDELFNINSNILENEESNDIGENELDQLYQMFF
ncbi:hypothetical protein C6P40_004616, partial [Pichia californica]